MTSKDEKVTTTKDQACLICFEDNASTGYSLVRLNNSNDGEQCRHSGCRACLRFYLIQRENDRKTTATCPEPDCQALIDDAVVRDCLGREYTPKVWFSKDDNDNAKQAQEEEDDPDESLKQWLRDNEAQQCWNCHAWITRSDGCEAMQCLCGWRFCWDCKAPIRASTDDDQTDRRCTCDIPADHFYDNILGYDRAEAPRLATFLELQDMATLYARREDEECSDYGSDFDRSEVESYALDKDDPDWFGDLGDSSDSDDDGWDDDSVVSECGVFIGSILDYEEPADDGVFDGTILEWEEPVGAMVGALVPLWADLADWVEENDAEAENDNPDAALEDAEDGTENDHLMAQEQVEDAPAGDEPADSFAGSEAMDEAACADDGSESEADALTTTGTSDAGMPQSAGKKENDGEGDDACSMTTASTTTVEDLEDRVAAIRLLEELAFWGPVLGPPPLN